VYVVGGLYGNLEALDAIERMVAEDEASLGEAPLVVFNGDFNFLNATSLDEWREVNRRVMQHTATAGNIEVEAVAVESDGSCGCAYPSYVGDAVVHRSNSIVSSLRTLALASDDEEDVDIVEFLRGLPKFMVVRVGSKRVAVVHGDAESLAGWAFSAEAMEPPDYELRRALKTEGDLSFSPTSEAKMVQWFEDARVDIFASTHTCMAFAQRFDNARLPGPTALVNNGSAGMPNFKGSTCGVVTRIALASLPAPRDSLYGAVLGDVRVDAVRVAYDHAAWVARFAANWPEGSPAHASYFDRIAHGVGFFKVEQAARRGFMLPLRALL
jgi:predicted phosphodiesterase